MPHLKIEIEDKIKELLSYYENKGSLIDTNSSLFSGEIGSFIFRLYAKTNLKLEDKTLEDELIQFIEKQISTPIVSTNLCDGVVGFAWFLKLLNKDGFIEFPENLFIDFDEVIHQTRIQQYKDLNHDFLHGALGSILYLTDRVKSNENCKKYIIDYIDFLDQTATKTNAGSFWYESPLMMDEMSQENRVINLHLSHGQASKIAILTKAYSSGIVQAKKLLVSAIDYILSLENKTNKHTTIPYVIINEQESMFMHLGWCRGNISISIALLLAAKSLQDTSLEKTAIEMALKTLSLDSLEKANIQEPALCHGTAGLMQMYNRLFQLTKIEKFKHAATKWLQRTLEMAVFEDGVAGFKSIDGYTKEWTVDHSLLDGASGIGLALVSYLYPEKMNWDECLLLS